MTEVDDDWDHVEPPNGPFRDGGMWVLTRKCSTCVFRPGNLMHLRDGTVDEMVQDCITAGSFIPCHETLDGPRSICRGFYDLHRDESRYLRLAATFDIIRFDDPPAKEKACTPSRSARSGASERPRTSGGSSPAELRTQRDPSRVPEGQRDLLPAPRTAQPEGREERRCHEGAEREGQRGAGAVSSKR